MTFNKIDVRSDEEVNIEIKDEHIAQDAYKKSMPFGNQFEEEEDDEPYFEALQEEEDEFEDN